ncbi:MAG: HEAT repeat domain-containing protein [Pirellulaceae bacterium]|nr:HEAT repeat domain-containing protein [Pirellulaceae bacterium]
MLNSSSLFHLVMAAVLCLMAGCGPAASGKSSKKGTKKVAAKKVVETFVPPPPPPKVDQSAFASVDAAMTKVEELVKNQDEKTGKEMLIVETWLQMQGNKIAPELAAKIKDAAGPLPTRITACRIVMKLGPASATPILMEATASEPRELRVKAIECLGRLKPTSKEIVDKIIGLMDDPEYEQRKAALGALASIGKPAGPAKDRLQAILNDTKEDETIRSLAKKALKAVDPRKGLMNAY